MLIKPRIPTKAPYIPFVLNDGMTILNYGLHSYTRLIVDCFDLTAPLAWRSQFRHNFIGLRPSVNCVPREIVSMYCTREYFVFIDARYKFSINYQPFMTLRDYFWSNTYPDDFDTRFIHTISADHELFEPPKLFDIPTGVVPLC